MIREGLGMFWSPWFMLVEVLILTLCIPLMLGYWLASQDRAGTFQPSAFIIVFFSRRSSCSRDFTASGM